MKWPRLDFTDYFGADKRFNLVVDILMLMILLGSLTLLMFELWDSL